MNQVQYNKLVVFVNGLVPLALLVWDAYHRKLGANPQEFATRATGVLTLTFLLLSLAVTPFRKAFAQPWLARIRRMLGLFSFFYGVLHLLTYMWFDKAFQLGTILTDIGKRPFIAVGMGSFLLLVPLAVTSNNRVIRWLGEGAGTCSTAWPMWRPSGVRPISTSWSRPIPACPCSTAAPSRSCWAIGS